MYEIIIKFMQDNMTSFIIGTIFSGISFGLGMWIRYRAKPKIEKIFDDNREYISSLLFTNVNDFDTRFKSFCDLLKKIIGKSEYSKCMEKERIVQISSDKDEEVLKMWYDSMKEQFKTLVDNQSLYRIYVQQTLLDNVNSYCKDGLFWAVWVIQGRSYSSTLDEQKKHKRKIIELIDKYSIDKNEIIEQFIKQDHYKL